MKRILIFSLALSCSSLALAQEVAPDWLRGVELKPTYAGGAGLIIERRCVPCHRPGEVAPMGFLTYEDFRKWARETHTPIVALAKNREMPPWPADPNVGRFRNWQFITQPEIDVLVKFLDSGVPRGEGEFRRDTEWVQGWSIGQPDAVFELPEYTVGEDVTGELKEFDIKTEFPEDRWIVAAEARPGDPFVVVSIEGGPLGNYRAGSTFVRHAEGTGRRLRAGESIKVRVHYMKEKGYTATDRSRLGVVFAKAPETIQTELLEAPMMAEPFTIPAGAAAFEVRARFEFPTNGRIHALAPDMHMRGTKVVYQAKMPDGAILDLLSIPLWDPKWKYNYELAGAVAVPKGTVVEANATFDNSMNNLKNPNPNLDVPFGPTGEWFFGNLTYSVDE